MKRVLTLIAVTLAALAAAGPAAARTHHPAHHRRAHHAVRHHHARRGPVCHRGRVRRRVRVVRRRHHRRVHVWVTRCERPRHKAKPKRKPTHSTAPQPTPPVAPVQIVYRAAVDPTFTQDAHNPLAVTYAYSAAAFAGTANLAATGQLPAGVLNFYSATTPGGPEQLFCSMNVGGAVVGGNCVITYAQTGAFDVTTQYVPNAASAVTETDSEIITPYATTTALTATQGTCGSGSPPGWGSLAGPYCAYTLTAGVSDSNGNTPATQVLLTGAPNTGQAAQVAQLPTGVGCVVYVTPSGIVTPNPPVSGCGSFSIGNGSIHAASWSLTADFAGSSGWSPSTAPAVTLTP